MAKYWASQKSRSLVMQRRKELDMLLDFANANQTELSSDHFERQIVDCLHMIESQILKSPLGSKESEADWIKMLQRHLRARLDKIIEKTMGLYEFSLWKISGALEFKVAAIDGRFHERFQPHINKGASRFQVAKQAVDLLLVEIIRDLDLRPNRFRCCPRCGTYFYQPTKREKSFCSIRCGDTVRIQRFRAKREIEPKNQIS